MAPGGSVLLFTLESTSFVKPSLPASPTLKSILSLDAP